MLLLISVRGTNSQKVNILFGQTTYDRLLNCLVKIGEKSPAFLLPFYVRIFSILPPLRGEFKASALKLVSWNVDGITTVN